MSDSDSGEGQAVTVPAAAKELYDIAGRLFENNKFEEAIRFYSEAIQLNPDYASAYFNRALSWTNIGNYKEARRDIEKAAEFEPNAADVLYVKGVISEYEHNFDDARAWYEKSLARNPNYSQAKSRLFSLNSRLSRTLPSIQEEIAKTGEDVEGLLLQIQAVKATLALPFLYIEDIQTADDFFQSLKKRGDYVGKLLVAEIAPRLAMQYLRWGRIDEAKKLLTDTFEASVGWSNEVFNQNTTLRRLLFNLVGPDKSPELEADINKSFNFWQTNVKKRIQIVEYSSDFNEWWRSGVQLDAGQSIIERAIMNMAPDISDDFVRSYALDFESENLTLQVLRNGVTEHMLKAFKDLWHKVKTSLPIVSKNVASDIFQNHLLMSLPDNPEITNELKSHSDLLTPENRMVVFGYWSLVDHTYKENFDTARKQCACRIESMARWALLLHLGLVTPAGALKKAMSEGTLNEKLVGAVIKHQPIKDVLRVHLEKSSEPFLRSETEFIRKLLSSEGSDEEILTKIALMRWSKGTFALLVDDCMKRENVSPVTTMGMEYGGIWTIYYKNLKERIERCGFNDLDSIRDALIRIALM